MCLATRLYKTLEQPALVKILLTTALQGTPPLHKSCQTNAKPYIQFTKTPGPQYCYGGYLPKSEPQIRTVIPFIETPHSTI